jgi:preprotein translocase SecE subunit
MFQKLFRYLKDVRLELSKVSWPSRSELTGASALVIGLSIVMAAFVYGCDFVLRFILGFFLRTGQ